MCWGNICRSPIAERVAQRMAADAGIDADVSLLTDFDPGAEPGSGVVDPWYGADSGFEDTLASVEAAMPGVLDRVRQLQQH